MDNARTVPSKTAPTANTTWIGTTLSAINANTELIYCGVIAILNAILLFLIAMYAIGVIGVIFVSLGISK